MGCSPRDYSANCSAQAPEAAAGEYRFCTLDGIGAFGETRLRKRSKRSVLCSQLKRVTDLFAPNASCILRLSLASKRHKFRAMAAGSFGGESNADTPCSRYS